MGDGCRIVNDFQRPEKKLMEAFRGIPVANIDDCMNRMGAISNAIKPVGRKGQFIGTALTVKVAQGDNLMFHAAMDLIHPGDVVMIDAGGYTDRAIFGELMTMYCKSRGAVGIICDGSIRDYDELAEMEGIAVYARSATPNGPYKNGPGEVGVPISIGGKIVRPGDIIVGDGDGVVIIPPSEAETLAAAAKKVVTYEADIRRHIITDGTYIRPWVSKKLEEIGCEIRNR
jgi:RraA family protein